MGNENYTTSDIPPEYLDRLEPERRKIAAEWGIVDFDSLLAASEGTGEDAENARRTLGLIEPYAVRHVIWQILDAAEEERLNHINDAGWMEKHKDDPAQKLNFEFKQAVFEEEAQKTRDFEEDCENLQDYRNPPDDVMSVPYDESDFECHFDEISFLARKTGRMDLLEHAEAMREAIYAACEAEDEEEFQRRELAFMRFAQSAKNNMASRLFVQQKVKQRIQYFIPALALHYVAARAYARGYARAYRSHRGTSSQTSIDDGGGGDDVSDSEPPRLRPHVIPKPRNHDSFSLPWPRHGCSRVGGRSS
jgi:hypothetical protein